MNYQKHGDEWIYPRMKRQGGYFVKCCDCALVHRFDFEFVRNTRGSPVLRFKAYRDERKTAACRRKRQR